MIDELLNEREEVVAQRRVCLEAQAALREAVRALEDLPGEMIIKNKMGGGSGGSGGGAGTGHGHDEGHGATGGAATGGGGGASFGAGGGWRAHG